MSTKFGTNIMWLILLVTCKAIDAFVKGTRMY